MRDIVQNADHAESLETRAVLWGDVPDSIVSPPALGAPLRVFALASYPIEAAGTRMRMTQFISALAAQGIHVTFLPFLGRRAYRWLYDPRYAALTVAALLFGSLVRIFQLPRLLRADVVLVQREAMLIGPPLVEWFVACVLRRPLVLDLDDATYIELPSPVYGRLANLLKWRGKTDWIIDHSEYVICGNERIAEHVRRRGRPAVAIPTIVDPDVFTPRSDDHGIEPPVIGWIGSHSTWPYVQRIIPVLERLAKLHRFHVRIVGAGRVTTDLRGVDLEVLPWSLDREVQDFQALDIGIYPLPDDEWAEGKSGLKAIEYLCAGVPYVASPVGIVAQIGEPEQTHLLATTPDEWYEALDSLLRDAEYRRAMGRAGRKHAVLTYSFKLCAERIGAVLRAAAGRDARDAEQGSVSTPAWWIRVPARLIRMLDVLPIVGFRGLAGGMPILIGLYIGHRWGLVPLGAYTFASSFAAVGLIVTDWGCTRWLPRELALAKVGSDDLRAAHASNSVRLIFASLYVLMTFAMTTAGLMKQEVATYAYELAILYGVAIISTDGMSDLIVARKTWRIASAMAIGLAVFFVGAFVADRFFATPYALVAAYIAGKIVEAAVLIAGRMSLLRFSSHHLWRMTVALGPFGVQAILAVIYSRVAIFIIENQRPLSDVGIVGAATALQGVVLLLPASMTLLHFPALSTAAAAQRLGEMLRIVRRSTAGSVVGVTVGLVVFASVRYQVANVLHIPLVYVPFVMALIAMSYLTIGTTMAGAVLQALGGEQLAAKLSFLTLGLSIPCRFIFIRYFGVWGVFHGALTSELATLVIFVFAAVRVARRTFVALRLGAAA